MRKIIISMADKRQQSYYPALSFDDLPMAVLESCIPGITQSPVVRLFYETLAYENGTISILIYFDEEGKGRRRLELWSYRLESEEDEYCAVQKAFSAIGLTGTKHTWEEYKKLTPINEQQRRMKKTIAKLAEQMIRMTKK